MIVSVRLTRGAAAFFANYSYSYTIDNAGVFKFTKTGQDGNGGAVELDMKPLLDHIQNERFKLDYIITSTEVLGQFISQDNPNFFFTGELE